jgi:hypothetical protein
MLQGEFAVYSAIDFSFFQVDHSCNDMGPIVFLTVNIIVAINFQRIGGPDK